MKRRAIDVKEIEGTVTNYNEHVSAGTIDQFGRRCVGQPLMGNRWLFLGPVKAYFTTTEGGAAINHRMQVIDVNGRLIPGLFAVGQNGLGGMVLWSHGLHIAWALTSGRLAGRNVIESTDSD